jgi:hypothetical protein
MTAAPLFLEHHLFPVHVQEQPLVLLVSEFDATESQRRWLVLAQGSEIQYEGKSDESQKVKPEVNGHRELPGANRVCNRKKDIKQAINQEYSIITLSLPLDSFMTVPADRHLDAVKGPETPAFYLDPSAYVLTQATATSLGEGIGFIGHLLLFPEPE